MRLFHFRAKDALSDRGTIDTVILTVSVAVGYQILSRYLVEKGRTDLTVESFQLVRAYSLSEIVFTDMEEGVR